MRHTISGLLAAFAVATASAAPALACGGGLFTGSCSPCGAAYVSPCAHSYAYSGCDTGCGVWGYERLSDPALQYHASPMRHQYYYVNQGPTFSGPGAFAPYPTYEDAGSNWDGFYHRAHYRARMIGMPYPYGHHEYPLRRSY
jgi:hypothetical protein